MKRQLPLVCLLMLAACGGGGSSSSDDSPDPAEISAPVIMSSSVSPTNLRFVGGNVAVNATVIDNRSVDSVSVDVAGPSGSSSHPMTAAGDDYSANISLSLNDDIYEGEDTYTFVIKATDSDGNKSSGLSATVTVQAMKRPPDPPLIP